MRRNILKMTLAAAFVCAAGFTAYRAQADAPSLSGLALENVEALANGETIGSHGTGPATILSQQWKEVKSFIAKHAHG